MYQVADAPVVQGTHAVDGKSEFFKFNALVIQIGIVRFIAQQPNFAS